MGRGGAPAREISFVSLMAYGPKVSDSALVSHGGLQLLKSGRAVPNAISPLVTVCLFFISMSPVIFACLFVLLIRFHL